MTIFVGISEPNSIPTSSRPRSRAIIPLPPNGFQNRGFYYYSWNKYMYMLRSYLSARFTSTFLHVYPSTHYHRRSQVQLFALNHLSRRENLALSWSLWRTRTHNSIDMVRLVKDFSSAHKPAVSMKIRRRLFERCISSTALYGCEFWALKASEKRLFNTQRKLERKMLGISVLDRWRNEKIRNTTKLRYWNEEALRRKVIWALRWANGIGRVEQNALYKKIFEKKNWLNVPTYSPDKLEHFISWTLSTKTTVGLVTALQRCRFWALWRFIKNLIDFFLFAKCIPVY